MKIPLALILYHTSITNAFHIILAGGTGNLGRMLASSLAIDGHRVTILCRNAFLAASPSRVSSDFGWLGRSFLDKYPSIKLRDWDGGDLLDIVGKDWIGWQDDSLVTADVVVNLVGGFTAQREMAAKRIVLESLRINPSALQVVVAPKDEELNLISPGARATKITRLKQCEDLVKMNCLHSQCLRLEANRVEKSCEEIKQVIYNHLM